MGNKSGDKGKGFEREVGQNILTPWCGFPIIRTPMSGAWAGTSGDIIPKRQADYHRFPFTVECKKQEGWDFFKTLAGKGAFHLYWLPQLAEEVIVDREMTGDKVKIPLLIFSKNRRDTFIALPGIYVQDSKFDLTNVFVRLTGDLVNTLTDGMFIFSLNEFMADGDYNEFQIYCRSAFQE